MRNKNYTNVMLEALEAALKPHSFRKRGSYLWTARADVVLLVQLQKSVSSTADRLRATVNLGVYSPVLARELGRTVPKPSISDCHWEARLGELMPNPQDKWWEAGDELEAAGMAESITAATLAYGLPALEEVASNAKLVELWRSGRSPGLTARQRSEYLALLERASAEP